MENLDNINPFIHEAAANINDDLLSRMFINNDNSDVIANQKNVFIKGFRGSGKSMLMRYNSFPIQFKNKNKSIIGIYISCMTPLFRRQDMKLNNNQFKVDIISEHLLVLTMAERLVHTFQSIDSNYFSKSDLDMLKDEFNFYFGVDTNDDDVLKLMQRWFRKQLLETQQHLNRNPEEDFPSIQTYSSLILPLIQVFKSTSKLSSAHFSFLIDDGQMLNRSQQISLNGWLSYRDLKDVSFKIAITSKEDYIFYTPLGSVILESHDYIMVDLEKELFSGSSGFVGFSKRIIEKRLDVFGITDKSAEDFFPIPKPFTDEMKDIHDKFIKGEYPERQEWTKKQRVDNASKYTRAIYFRLNFDIKKANKPKYPYTGCEVIINISTGVVRNLLLPCYIMYEKQKQKDQATPVLIDYKIQYETLIEESSKTWDEISELSVRIINCTDNDTIALKNVLDNFGDFLKDKLLDPNATEKKILSFTISDLKKSHYKTEIETILNIGVQGGLIYTRTGPDHSGGRTTWYTPKRILWPVLGLDPVGQNGRKNFLANDFFQMMKDPEFIKNKVSSQSGQDQTELKF